MLVSWFSNWTINMIEIQVNTSKFLSIKVIPLCIALALEMYEGAMFLPTHSVFKLLGICQTDW